MTLSNKVALVTGAGRGIGAAAAIALAQAGANIAVLARTRDDAQAIATRIGTKAIALAGDVTDADAIDACIAQIVRTFGGFDILVSNAGIIQPIGHIADLDPRAWLRAIEINLAGAFICARAALPHLLARGGGTIVHLSSGAAHRPMEGWSAYCASKAGLAMFTRSLHEEYGALGVRAIGFLPGVVDTGMQGEIRASGLNPVSKIPRENLRGVDEPAQAIAYLCGPDGTKYSGEEVDIRTPEFRTACGLPPIG